MTDHDYTLSFDYEIADMFAPKYRGRLSATYMDREYYNGTITEIFKEIF